MDLGFAYCVTGRIRFGSLGLEITNKQDGNGIGIWPKTIYRLGKEIWAKFGLGKVYPSTPLPDSALSGPSIDYCSVM